MTSGIANNPWQHIGAPADGQTIAGANGVPVNAQLSPLQVALGNAVNARSGFFNPDYGVSLMEPGSGVVPTVVVAGTGWTLSSSGFVAVNNEQWFKVTMTGTGGGVGQLDFILTGLRPFGADSILVEYMADHSQGSPLNANLSVDTNFTTSVGVFTNGRNMTAPNNSDPLMHVGRNSVLWCKPGMSVQGASFVISAAEPVIGKPWTGIRVRRAINNITGTVTMWLRSIRVAVAARRGRLAIVADDGYHSWFRMGVPILSRYGIVSTAAIIPTGVGVNSASATGNAVLQELKDYVAAGNFCVGHGPNASASNLFAGPLAGGVEKTQARVDDMLFGYRYLLDNGLADAAGAASYAWPQGIYNSGNGGVELLDAAYAAGFRLARCATAYPLLLQKIGSLSPRSHSRLTIPIIGHTYAGASNTADDATETTNINAIITTIQNIASAGVDGVLMLHRVVNRGTATAGGIEIETDRLAALCAAIQPLVAAGTLECVGFPELAYRA